MAFPSLSIAITRLIESSPFVIILKIAFLSAHTPNVHAVSTHTPTYIFPDTDSTAAETPPASMILETDRSEAKTTRGPVDLCSVPTGSQRPVDVGSEPTVVERRGGSGDQEKSIKQYNTK